MALGLPAVIYLKQFFSADTLGEYSNRMMRLRALAAFCRRMGIGLRSGVDILKLLENEAKSGDKQHRETMLRMRDKIRSGTVLFTVFEPTRLGVHATVDQKHLADVRPGRLSRRHGRRRGGAAPLFFLGRLPASAFLA